jgi:hypothetical protein
MKIGGARQRILDVRVELLVKLRGANIDTRVKCPGIFRRNQFDDLIAAQHPIWMRHKGKQNLDFTHYRQNNLGGAGAIGICVSASNSYPDT